MFVEVIAQHEHDIIAAQTGGADRIELVADMEADGLSPSVEMVRSAIAVAKIPIRVMVRFHNEGFCYKEAEVAAMIGYMEQVRELQIDGFVLGVLNSLGGVDWVTLDRLVRAAGGKKITFHRAFDDIVNQRVAIARLEQQYPTIDTILTSGVRQHPIGKNIDLLVALQAHAQRLIILAGGGVTPLIAEQLQKHQLLHVHVGSCVRQCGDFTREVMPDLVRGIKDGSKSV